MVFKCDFCEKEFKLKSGKTRHEKNCELNKNNNSLSSSHHLLNNSSVFSLFPESRDFKSYLYYENDGFILLFKVLVSNSIPKHGDFTFRIHSKCDHLLLMRHLQSNYRTIIIPATMLKNKKIINGTWSGFYSQFLVNDNELTSFVMSIFNSIVQKKICIWPSGYKTIIETKIYDNNILTKKKCTVCKTIKDISNFSKQSRTCKKCVSTKVNSRINKNMDSYFSILLGNAKSHSSQRVEKGRDQAGKFLLTLKDLKDQFNKQSGKCYYSNITLKLNKSSDWQCSLERLNPEEGYITKNIALITQEFQSPVQWTPEKFSVFENHLVNPAKSNQVDWEKKTRKNTGKRITVIKNDIMLIQCTACDTFKTEQNYTKNSIVCKSCQSYIREQYQNTPIGHLGKMIHNMQKSSKKKKLPMEFTIEKLKFLFIKQKGLCYYTEIPMTFGKYKNVWWTCSPERLDISQGYTLKNVRLVCFEFNTANRTITIENSIISGNGAWSKEKVCYLKQHLTNNNNNCFDSYEGNDA